MLTISNVRPYMLSIIKRQYKCLNVLLTSKLCTVNKPTKVLNVGVKRSLALNYRTPVRSLPCLLTCLNTTHSRDHRKDGRCCRTRPLLYLQHLLLCRAGRNQSSLATPLLRYVFLHQRLCSTSALSSKQMNKLPSVVSYCIDVFQDVLASKIVYNYNISIISIGVV